MKFRTLIRRNLRFHWRAHLGVVLGAAVGSAALIGALVVGDSVRESLRQRALIRLGGVRLAMNAKDRFFETRLFDRMLEAATTNTVIVSRAPARRPTVVWGSSGQWNGSVGLELAASVTRQDGAARANAVHCYGLDARFFKFFIPSFNLNAGTVCLNEALGRQLGVHTGDRLVFRIQRPSLLSGDASFSQRSEAQIALPLGVAKILPARPGEFSLRAGQSPPLNAFLPLEELQRAVARGGRANLMLAGWGLRVRQPTSSDHLGALIRDFLASARNFKNPFQRGRLISVGEVADDNDTLAKLEAYLREQWSLEDAEVDLIVQTNQKTLEIRSKRVFLDTPIVRSAHQAETNAQPILTYLVNLLGFLTNSTPYSMVTAAGPPWTPANMREDEILVSQWLAEDLHAKPGDEIALTYFDPESGARLTERTNTFRVRGVVPMEMPWADRTLMPDFPGLEKAESTSDWDAGFPLVHKIRPKDEEYWKKSRGTPKAFVTLAAGQRMWGNRFGNLTAIRFPVPTNELGGAESYHAALEKKILANLKPEELGLRFEPVRDQALRAAEESQDFGGLFLGFSFFLIIAALLLMAMLFSFGLERRAPEIGTLLALGFTPKQVRRLLLREGLALSLLGGILGTFGGLAYARAMLQGLTTIWRDAVGSAALSFHFTTQTLVIGLFASVAVGAFTVWLSLRKFARRPARELLVGEVQNEEPKVRSPKSKVVGIGALLLAMGFVGWTLVKGDTANAGAFFGAGALVLIAGLGLASAWLARRTGISPVSDSCRPSERDGRDACPTLASLAVRGCARRRKRSLATVAMLACGSFLIVSIGVFRLDANRDASKRNSGTGGFAIIGESTMPVAQDLNSQSGRDFFALNERDLTGVSFVPFRVREGDEASCLNLNAAQRPRLLGVKPEMLEGRFAFAKGAGWQSLKSEIQNLKSPIEIPAIGDANSIQWAMHKKVGDTIDFVDERGQPFKVRIVGAVANSILQGQLIIDEAEFVKRFPNESGYRVFLVDAPTNATAQVSATLSRAVQDAGLELTPAAQRLAQFNAVQNTYLGTFQVLGGLGLLLGSVGLGIIVMRNVLERRRELAVLLAIGFRARVLQKLLLWEHGALLVAGFGIGVAAAAVAVLPSVLSPGAELPYRSLGLTLVAVLANGVVWTWVAARFALRGNLLDALRNE